MTLSLDFDTLKRAYASGELTPLAVVEQLAGRYEQLRPAGVFIGEPFARAREEAKAVMQRRERGERMRLYGLPFAVKDNIDVGEVETTAACPAFAYRAQRDAVVVSRLRAEGAIFVGKTNLDQFATGLVGARSPYGIPRNAFDSRYVSGGSSSGSAVAVALGLCSFALGTDTAGSGRVPAAFNNLVGLKPSRGMLSARGVVPACRSLDCVSVLALTIDDAAEVAQLAAGFDAEDPYSRRDADRWDPRPGLLPSHFRFGVPRGEALQFDGSEWAELFARVVEALHAAGGRSQDVDLAPFRKAGALLYEGPWVAERLEAPRALLARDPEAVHPVVRSIFAHAADYGAPEVFAGLHELSALRNVVDGLWNDCDFLLLPSAPGLPLLDHVLAEPITANARLGTYTNFVNLLDLCALALPAGFGSDGLPFGVTLIARRGRDGLLASVGRALHSRLCSSLGATGCPLPPLEALPPSPGERARLAVVGAHLSGEPLNRELVDLGARLERASRTAPRYRLYALQTTPPKPGLVRVAQGEPGFAIELEVYALDDRALGRFLRGVPSPLSIGTLELEDGSSVQGFLCESAAVQGQRDISSFGGWREFRKQNR